MTAAADREALAEVVKLLREAAADGLIYAVAPAVQSQMVERIDRYARRRAAEELGSLVSWARSSQMGRLTVDGLHRECKRRADALTDHEETR